MVPNKLGFKMAKFPLAQGLKLLFQLHRSAKRARHFRGHRDLLEFGENLLSGVEEVLKIGLFSRLRRTKERLSEDQIAVGEVV